jgi:NADPH:quinone reductase-like Zn-dependent oxidoreductase
MSTASVLRLRNGFGLDNLHVEQEDLPTPGAGEVHVRFHAGSLNYRDLMVALGQYNPKMELPRILGSDAAGEIVSVGPNVSGLKPGDRVASLFFQSWQAGEITQTTGKSALGGAIDGVFASDRILPATGLIRIPDELSFEEAATLPCAAVTAWNALVEKGHLHAGQTVLILGTGGVSLFGLQLAKAHGAKVILTSSSDEKLQRGKQLGADELINYRTTPDWDEEVMRLTGRRGVDHVVEVGGSGTLPRSFHAVRVGGHVHLIGVLSEPGKGVDVLAVLRKSIHFNGIYVGSREMFSRLNAALVTNHVKPVIDRVFPLSEARAAFEYMQSGSHFGKIVLKLTE